MMTELLRLISIGKGQCYETENIMLLNLWRTMVKVMLNKLIEAIRLHMFLDL